MELIQQNLSYVTVKEEFQIRTTKYRCGLVFEKRNHFGNNFERTVRYEYNVATDFWSFAEGHLIKINVIHRISKVVSTSTSRLKSAMIRPA